MTTPATSPTPTSPPSRRRLVRTRALLAGGAVLGVGALVTLAAWSDDVFTAGNFETGSFDIQANVGSTDPEAEGWQDYDSDAAFIFPSTELEPGQTARAWIALRTHDSDYDAQVILQGTTDTGNPGDLANDLTYSAWAGVSVSDCTNNTMSWEDQIVFDQPLDWGSGPFTLSQDGTVETVCVAVSLPLDSNAQGQALEATWSFEAESSDPI